MLDRLQKDSLGLLRFEREDPFLFAKDAAHGRHQPRGEVSGLWGSSMNDVLKMTSLRYDEERVGAGGQIPPCRTSSF